ncbi:MAG: patatin-like phospholipase family protein, partial [Desulfobacterales bacterium]|nr:patatin-like phospholipase family protein [Desulfobacterales bacterium]
VAAFLPDIDIEQTSIPLVVSAVDLITGQAAALSKGPLIKAVMASCAVPGFMPPVCWNDMMLIDGGAVTNIPAEMARSAGADLVVGVDAGGCLCRPPLLDDGIDIMGRAVEIMNVHLNDWNARQTDLLIVPEVKPFMWTDFHCFEEIIAKGRKAAGRICEKLTREGMPWKEVLRRECDAHDLYKDTLPGKDCI